LINVDLDVSLSCGFAYALSMEFVVCKHFIVYSVVTCRKVHLIFVATYFTFH